MAKINTLLWIIVIAVIVFGVYSLSIEKLGLENPLTPHFSIHSCADKYILKGVIGNRNRNVNFNSLRSRIRKKIFCTSSPDDQSNINSHESSKVAKGSGNVLTNILETIIGSNQSWKRKLDIEFIGVAAPAFVALAADPLASIIDAIFVGRLGAADQGAMGVAISSQYSVAKLYNDPLLKTSTSLVAGKEGDELEASVATAIVTSVVIGGT